MRHRVAHRKLGRVTEHRLAMLRNLATALLQHEHIETTVPRAKELRPFTEQLITVAKRGLAKGGPAAIHARRLVGAEIVDKDVLKKLFDTLAPRYAERPGGYVRIIKAGFRRGDSADMARIELLGSEFDPKKAEAAKEAKGESKGEGLGGRIRRAAERVRGRKADDAEAGPVHEHTKAVTKTTAKPRQTGRSGKGS
ncbi:MAG: 50S ribosomal protein L17 [Rhodospirillaceae bacterium]